MNNKPEKTSCEKHPDSLFFSTTLNCVACTLEEAEQMPWPIMTRKQAITGGYKKYWTGKTCGNGHNKQRYSTSGICTGCNSINSMKHAKRLKKELAKANEGLIPLKLMVHPDHIKAIEDFAAKLANKG